MLPKFKKILLIAEMLQRVDKLTCADFVARIIGWLVNRTCILSFCLGVIYFL